MKKAEGVLIAILVLSGLGVTYYAYTTSTTTVANESNENIDFPLLVSINTTTSGCGKEWSLMQNVSLSVLTNMSRNWMLYLSGALIVSSSLCSIFIRLISDSVSSNQTISSAGSVNYLNAMFVLFLSSGNHTIGFEWYYHTNGMDPTYIFFGGHCVTVCEYLGIIVQMIPL